MSNRENVASVNEERNVLYFILIHLKYTSPTWLPYWTVQIYKSKSGMNDQEPEGSCPD